MQRESANLSCSVRVFLGVIGLGLGIVQAAETLPAGLVMVPGPVNGARIEHAGRALVVYGDPSGQAPVPDLVLMTHARRDAAWSVRALAQRGAQLVVPAEEAGLLTQPGEFWEEWREKRFHDYAQQSAKVMGEALGVGRAVRSGDSIAWAGREIRVIGTPGYTRGSVSYLVELGGRRIAFTGDLIRDDGKLQDLFSLQDAIPEARVGGYHGWAGRLGQLMASLDRLAAEQPDVLVPLRGQAILDPAGAINRLQERIRAVYANYLSIDALRWYFKDDHVRAKARRVMGPGAEVEWMPMAETTPLPPFILALANSRLVLAADGSGFLVDCGGMGIIEALRRLQAEGRLTSLEHVMVTHYHDDHTDALPTLVKEFGARVHACGSLVDLIQRPGDYRLPCLTRNPTSVTAPHQHGDSWRWKEYRMTILDFPGQTLHHNALLVEPDEGWPVLFAGDSFTPSGIDDYCLQNRNILREGHGYLRCLDLLETLPSGCWVLNQHVEPAFRFSASQVETMRDTLRRRLPLLRELLPFDDPNFGLDETWSGLHPYWNGVRPGEWTRLALRVTNHSPLTQTFRTRIRAPEGYEIRCATSLRVPAHTDGWLPVTVRVPARTPPGLALVTADLGWGDGELREWTEAVLEVIE